MNIDRSTEKPSSAADATAIKLPPPKSAGAVSVEEAITRRRSTREFTDRALLVEELSQLLWSLQGTTDNQRRLRAAPSAGATFPLEVISVIGDFGVSGLPAGLYLYLPSDHALKPIRNGDVRQQLAGVALGQQAVAQAPASLVIAADYERTRRRYRNRTERYVHMEAGHAAQNLYLQATALGLGTNAIGAFDDDGVRQVLQLAPNLQPLYILPIGKPV
jgi:SagB-type dehydrogenase family enzyme